MTQKRRVQAIILAGGFGTRLYPLTQSKPKPLVTILDKTVLEGVVEKVRLDCVEKVTVSTFYKSDMIDKKCKEIDGGIECVKETRPLGTAGGVKNCADDGFDAYLVVSGDGVFDFDLKAVVDYHFERCADVTICSASKEDPTLYGNLECDDEQNVVKFCEKPCWNSVTGGRVNTGIYVLSRYAVDRIPERCEYDFSKDLFPKLLKEGRCIKAVNPDGSWCDIGSLDEYFSCNMEAAKHECGKSLQSLRCDGVHAFGNVYVSEKASFGKNISINNGIVCDGCIVGDDCDITDSVIGRGTSIGKGCSISGVILGENVSVGENCILSEDSVIGDGCRISDGCAVRKNARIAPYTVLYREDDRNMEFSRERHLFKSDGICIFERDEQHSEYVKFARALCLALKKREEGRVRIAVACSQEHLWLKNAFLSGFAMESCSVFDAGDCTDSMLCHAVGALTLDVGFMIDENDGRAEVRLYCPDGSYIDENTERKIIKIYSQPLQDSAATSTCFSKVKLPAHEIYKAGLSAFVLSLLQSSDCVGNNVSVICIDAKNNAACLCLSEVLSEHGCKVSRISQKGNVNIIVSQDGRSVAVRYENETYDALHLCAAVLKNSDILGTFRVNLGESIPEVFSRYVNGEQRSNEGVPLLYDGCFLAAALICALSLRGENLKRLMSEVAPFYVYSDEYLADVNRSQTLERLANLYRDSRDENSKGIHLRLAEGSVTVIPNRAKGFKIVSQAASMEAAKELCGRIERAIKM